MSTPARILLAEDDSSLSDLLAGWLRAEGHDVVVVDNGYDAVREATTADFDLYLLDVMIPGVTVDVVARRVLGSRPDASVLHITGSYGLEKTGDRPALRKPFSHAELVEFVEEHLR